MKRIYLSKIFLSLLFIMVNVSVGGLFTMSQALGASSSAMEVSNQTLSGEVVDGVRVVKVTASKYKFAPDPIVVSVGERVRIDLTSADVAHGFAISAFKFNLSVSAKETKSAEFTAEKQGVFKVGCSVFCGFGHGHMHGKLIVR